MVQNHRIAASKGVSEGESYIHKAKSMMVPVGVT